MAYMIVVIIDFIPSVYELFDTYQLHAHYLQYPMNLMMCKLE